LELTLSALDYRSATLSNPSGIQKATPFIIAGELSANTGDVPTTASFPNEAHPGCYKGNNV
jgi:hypothetical protein